MGYATVARLRGVQLWGGYSAGTVPAGQTVTCLRSRTASALRWRPSALRQRPRGGRTRHAYACSRVAHPCDAASSATESANSEEGAIVVAGTAACTSQMRAVRKRGGPAAHGVARMRRRSWPRGAPAASRDFAALRECSAHISPAWGLTPAERTGCRRRAAAPAAQRSRGAALRGAAKQRRAASPKCPERRDLEQRRTGRAGARARSGHAPGVQQSRARSGAAGITPGGPRPSQSYWSVANVPPGKGPTDVAISRVHLDACATSSASAAGGACLVLVLKLMMADGPSDLRRRLHQWRKRWRRRRHRRAERWQFWEAAVLVGSLAAEEAGTVDSEAAGWAAED